jgi:2-polyprenyl-3-methyl-5-hydroxy-6-metoxy-1,4-benzoquinol methylase
LLEFDIELTDAEIAEMAALPPAAWFTAVRFANAESPAHPRMERLEQNNARKQAAVASWIERVAPGKSVLDTFAANGAFSFMASEAGARRVVGIELDEDRVAAANLVARFLRARGRAPDVEFHAGNVYDLTNRAEQFDVSLCLGGLYHIADPPYVLRELRAVTSEYLVLQTSSILKGRKNHAEFRVRGDMTSQGLTSIVAGSGKWYMTAVTFREMLRHAGFEVVEETANPPAYSALCRVHPADSADRSH